MTGSGPSVAGAAVAGALAFEALGGSWPPLAPDEARVVLADAAAPTTGDALDALDAAERGRAARFHREADRRRYAAAHALLRRAVAAELGVAPGDLRFAADARGKPELAEPAGTGLRLSLSHSGSVALVALTRVGPVGVDVERARPLDDLARLAARALSPAERAELDALPPELRVAGFLAAWTRKEAYVKALGSGLSHPLDAFDVALDPRRPPALRACRDGERPDRWTLAALAPAEDHAAALAVRGRAAVRAAREAP